MLPKLSDFGQNPLNKKIDAESAMLKLSEKLPDDAQNMSSFKNFMDTEVPDLTPSLMTKPTFVKASSFETQDETRKHSSDH
jgi:hypothetical protein